MGYGRVSITYAGLIGIISYEIFLLNEKGPGPFESRLVA